MSEDNAEHWQIKRTMVGLDELVEGLAAFCDEDLDVLTDDDLDECIEHLIRYGPPENVEFVVDEHGRKLVTEGHRWVRACRRLVSQGVDGFTEDMAIQARQLANASPEELLLWCVQDRLEYLDLNYLQRMRIARDLHEAGIAPERAAAALGIPDQAYEALLARAEQLNS